MTEKYDGVRVVWDGKHLCTATSRLKIDIPQGSNFPPIPFEGMLWFVSLFIVDLISF
jgi:hypothetical protein